MQTPATVEATFEDGIKRSWNLLLNQAQATYVVIEYISSVENTRPIVYRPTQIYNENEIGIGRPKLLDCLSKATEVFFNGKQTNIGLI